jgi:uncharacterized protein YxeA
MIHYLYYTKERKTNMKKIIALLLIVIMCSSFAACDNSAEENNNRISTDTNNTQTNNKKAEIEKNIVGIWENTDDRDVKFTVTVNNDCTGTYKIYFDENDYALREFTWKYSNDLNCYIFIQPGYGIIPIFIENDNDKDYIIFNEEKCYHQNNIE